jgi:hypothetical protein
MTKTTRVTGRVLRVDYFGRVVLDACRDFHEHVVDPAEHDGSRPSCALLVDEHLFPHEARGKKGTYTITVEFEETA